MNESKNGICERINRFTNINTCITIFIKVLANFELTVHSKAISQIKIIICMQPENTLHQHMFLTINREWEREQLQSRLYLLPLLQAELDRRLPV